MLFERKYGQSPQVYRNKRRIHIAADLLRNSDQRIKEISELIGCRHVSRFCALFKSAYAISRVLAVHGRTGHVSDAIQITAHQSGITERDGIPDDKHLGQT